MRKQAKIFIDGAAGTTGLEIRERLAGREGLSLMVLPEAQRKDAAARKAALNGADALACLQEQSFVLALIDMKLPMMDGLQLAGALKVVAPTIVIILISGYYYAEDPEIEKKLDQNFCAGFIAKPFDVEDVRSTIRRVLH